MEKEVRKCPDGLTRRVANCNYSPCELCKLVSPYPPKTLENFKNYNELATHDKQKQSSNVNFNYDNPLNTKGIATKIILIYIPEDKLTTMWEIFKTTACLIRDFKFYRLQFLIPDDIRIKIIENIYKIDSIYEKGDLVNKIRNEITKAIEDSLNKTPLLEKRKNCKRSDFWIRQGKPHLTILEAEDEFTIPIAFFCFFLNCLVQGLNKEGFMQLVNLMEKNGFNFSIEEKAKLFRKKLNCHFKYYLYSSFFEEQGLYRSGESIKNIYKRYSNVIYPLYYFIYKYLPHGQGFYKRLPEPPFNCDLRYGSSIVEPNPNWVFFK